MLSSDVMAKGCSSETGCSLEVAGDGFVRVTCHGLAASADDATSRLVAHVLRAGILLDKATMAAEQVTLEFPSTIAARRFLAIIWDACSTPAVTATWSFVVTPSDRKTTRDRAHPPVFRGSPIEECAEFRVKIVVPVWGVRSILDAIVAYVADTPDLVALRDSVFDHALDTCRLVETYGSSVRMPDDREKALAAVASFLKGSWLVSALEFIVHNAEWRYEQLPPNKRPQLTELLDAVMMRADEALADTGFNAPHDIYCERWTKHSNNRAKSYLRFVAADGDPDE